VLGILTARSLPGERRWKVFTPSERILLPGSFRTDHILLRKAQAAFFRLLSLPSFWDWTDVPCTLTSERGYCFLLQYSVQNLWIIEII
jgi:hypothetical protein